VEEAETARASRQSVSSITQLVLHMPAIVGLAVLVAVIPPLMLGRPATWTYRACAVVDRLPLRWSYFGSRLNCVCAVGGGPSAKGGAATEGCATSRSRVRSRPASLTMAACGHG
jgi:hypothetical protein